MLIKSQLYLLNESIIVSEQVLIFTFLIINFIFFLLDNSFNDNHKVNQRIFIILMPC